MKKISVSTSAYVGEIDVEVEVDVDEIVSDLDEEATRKLLDCIAKRSGDPTTERYVERAFLAALRLPDLPRELADLFWHVHGRAI
jgi:hypothetical protein